MKESMGGGFETGADFAEAKKASLEEVLAFREEKAEKQAELLDRFHFPLLCLAMNIPGEYKRFFLADSSFQEELRITRLTLEAEQIQTANEEIFESSGGSAAFISANADPKRLKLLAQGIEDSHPLGRLFDIDVLDTDGKKISREDMGFALRSCLICGGSAFVCGRSRTHSAEELQKAATDLMIMFRRECLENAVISAAQRALVGEAAISPKPGLVDRLNNGAHRDMDFFSFIDSSAAIIPYLKRCAVTGFNAAKKPPLKMEEGFPAALFQSLRLSGKIAEIEMFAATGGANTQKGLIFSLGVASAAYGSFFRFREKVEAGDVLDFVSAMTAGIMDDFNNSSGDSHGKEIFKKFGTGGVREEARRGFPSVRNCALPVLRRCLAETRSLNAAGITALLHLLSTVTDTNIIHRAGREVLNVIQKDVSAFLATCPSPEAIINYAENLDRQFIEKNISPGGCADLLAISLFLYRLCG
jgi:holo-ACP synthase/triphosphoribosyl-dephospho-CoA synthase